VAEKSAAVSPTLVPPGYTCEGLEGVVGLLEVGLWEDGGAGIVGLSFLQTAKKLAMREIIKKAIKAFDLMFKIIELRPLTNFC
jgi:hypothetical protein